MTKKSKQDLKKISGGDGSLDPVTVVRNKRGMVPAGGAGLPDGWGEAKTGGFNKKNSRST